MIIGETLRTGPGTALFFLDETGHEELSDPNYPIFGIGGCAVLAESYEAHVRTPWRAMKALHFGGADIPLHASELLRGRPSPEQLAGIGAFFEKGEFHRVVAIMNTSTHLDEQMRPAYKAMSVALVARMRKVLERVPFDHIGIVVEDCERTRGLTDEYLGPLGFAIDGEPVSITRGRMTKANGEPGLEVADFILHAAGTHVRTKLGGSTARRRDFDAVFRKVREELVSYIELDAIRTEGRAPP